eukprot:Nk52_evm32s2391 gene=Nk52_evmTU32s2391
MPGETDEKIPEWAQQLIRRMDTLSSREQVDEMKQVMTHMVTTKQWSARIGGSPSSPPTASRPQQYELRTGSGSSRPDSGNTDNQRLPSRKLTIFTGEDPQPPDKPPETIEEMLAEESRFSTAAYAWYTSATATVRKAYRQLKEAKQVEYLASYLQDEPCTLWTAFPFAV